MAREISPEKLRDMVRSILPSKNREAARKAKKRETRRARRTVRVDVHRDDPRADLRRDADQRMNVQWRRDGDKLNHFMRWCSERTYGMSLDEALAYVRRILPRNLIGDHAFGHWETHAKYRHHPRPRFRELLERAAQRMYDQTRHRLRRALELAPDQLGVLNAEIKRRKEPDAPRRLLRGMHDIDEFVSVVLFGTTTGRLAPRDYCLTCSRIIERDCLLEVVIAVEIAHGPKRAVRRSIPTYLV